VIDEIHIFFNQKKKRKPKMLENIMHPNASFNSNVEPEFIDN
jgi:hypothetical protein